MLVARTIGLHAGRPANHRQCILAGTRTGVGLEFWLQATVDGSAKALLAIEDFAEDRGEQTQRGCQSSWPKAISVSESSHLNQLPVIEGRELEPNRAPDPVTATPESGPRLLYPRIALKCRLHWALLPRKSPKAIHGMPSRIDDLDRKLEESAGCHAKFLVARASRKRATMRRSADLGESTDRAQKLALPIAAASGLARLDLRELRATHSRPVAPQFGRSAVRERFRNFAHRCCSPQSEATWGGQCPSTEGLYARTRTRRRRRPSE